jgi:hypothetical protein
VGSGGGREGKGGGCVLEREAIEERRIVGERDIGERGENKLCVTSGTR